MTAPPKRLRRAVACVALLGAATALACSGTGGPASPESAHDAGTPLVVEDLPDDEMDIPCAPRLVLQTVCQKCHVRPMRNGAPFPLQRRSDVVVHHYGGVVVRELMIEEVTAGRMPLTPVTIADDDKATLLTWLDAGAPAEPDASCAAVLADGGDAAVGGDAADALVAEEGDSE